MERQCVCGEIFQVPFPSYKKKYCSRACMYKLRIVPRSLDLIGSKFGLLTVIEEFEGGATDYGKKRWRATCECGQERIVTTQDLRRADNKRIRHCNDSIHWRGKGSPKWTGGEHISGSKWRSIQAAARRRSLVFDITIEYVELLIDAQAWTCALTGRELDTKSMSLDRIDSTEGYVVGNVQWVHWLVNRAKMDLSETDFISLCKDVVTHVG